MDEEILFYLLYEVKQEMDRVMKEGKRFQCIKNQYLYRILRLLYLERNLKWYVARLKRFERCLYVQDENTVRKILNMKT